MVLDWSQIPPTLPLKAACCGPVWRSRLTREAAFRGSLWPLAPSADSVLQGGAQFSPDLPLLFLLCHFLQENNPKMKVFESQKFLGLLLQLRVSKCEVPYQKRDCV